MYMENAEPFNYILTLLEQPEINQPDRLSALQACLASLDTDTLMTIHAELSPKALFVLKSLSAAIYLKEAALSHVLWRYYEIRLQEPGPLSDELFEEMLADYRRYPDASMESVWISAIKKEKPTPDQLELVHPCFEGDVLNKEYMILTCKRTIAAGSKLGVQEVENLLQMGAFAFLETVLACNALNAECLKLFQPAFKGEVQRKVKQKLYEQAQMLLKPPT